jgi:hypothetical protein
LTDNNNNIVPTFVIRFATIEEDVLEVFAVCTYADILETDNKYLKAFVNMGKIDYNTMTITRVTSFGAEFFMILLQTELHGFLPELNYDFDESGWNHLLMLADLMMADTFLTRLNFVETTTLLNPKARRLLLSSDTEEDVFMAIPECYIESFGTCFEKNEDLLTFALGDDEAMTEHEVVTLSKSILKSTFHCQSMFGSEVTNCETKEELFRRIGFVFSTICYYADSCEWMANTGGMFNDYLLDRIVLMSETFENFWRKSKQILNESWDDLEYRLYQNHVTVENGLILLTLEDDPNEEPSSIPLQLSLPIRLVEYNEEDRFIKMWQEVLTVLLDEDIMRGSMLITEIHPVEKPDMVEDSDGDPHIRFPSFLALRPIYLNFTMMYMIPKFLDRYDPLGARDLGEDDDMEEDSHNMEEDE